MLNVGGLNVAIGIDTSALSSGVKDAKNILEDFKRSLTTISLEKVIKGDSLKSLNDYLKQTKKGLDSVFTQFAKYTKTADVGMGSIANKAKRNAEKVISEWDKMVRTLKRDPRFNIREILTENLDVGGGISSKGLYKYGGLATTIVSQIKKTIQRIRRLPNISEELRKKLLFKNNIFLSGIKMTTKEAKKELGRLANIIEKDVGTTFGAKFQAMMAKLQKAYRMQRGAEQLKQVQQARDLNLAYENRRKTLQKLLTTQLKYQTQIKAGINVEENRRNLLQSYDTQRRLGIELTKKQTAAYLKQYAASLKIAKVTTFDRSKYAVELKNASSIIEATKRRGIAVRKLKLEEAKLTAEMKIGMNVRANRIALIKNLESREKMLGGLDDKRRRQLQALRIEEEKLREADTKAAQKAGARGGFMSPGWLKYRLTWFVQLRLAWGVYRGMGAALRSLVDAEDQLARAMRTANSEVMNGTQIAERYRDAMNKAAASLGASWQQSGEVLYQLTSAGLTSEEAIAGLKPALNLIIGLEGDARETTKILASVYRNFGDTIVDVTTKEEKLQYIADLIAKTWKRHQVELSELNSAYAYIAAGAKAVGMSLKEVTAYLAVLHDHAIKGARASRMLNNILSKISRNRHLFKELFQIDIDLNKPLNLTEIFEKLNKRLGKGALSVGKLTALFEIFGLRSNVAAITLAQSIKEVNDEMANTKTIAGESDKIVAKRLESLAKQYDRFKKAFIASFHGAFASVEAKMTLLLEAINKHLEENTIKQYGAEKIVLDLLRIPNKADLEKAINSLGDDAVNIIFKNRERIAKELSLNVDVVKKFGGRGSVKQGKLSDSYWSKTIFYSEENAEKIKKFIEDLFIPDDKKINKALDKIKAELAKSAKKSSTKQDKREKTLAEIQLEILRESKNPLRQISKYKELIAYYTKLEAASELDIAEARKKGDIAAETLNRQDQLKYTKKRVAAEKKIEQIRNSLNSKEVKALSIDQRKVAAKVRTLQLQDKELNLQGLTSEEYKQRLINIQKEKEYAYTIADNTKKIAILRGVDSKLAEEEANNMKIEADQSARTAREQAKILRYNTERREISKSFQKQISVEEQILERMKLQHATEAEITAQKIKINNLTLEKAKIDEELAIKNQQTRLSIEKAINQAKTRGISLAEELYRETHPFYAIWADLKDRIKDVDSFIRDLGSQTIDNFASSFSDLVVSIAQGSERMGASLRKFFLNLINDINRTIIRWLVLNAISGIMGSFGPKKVNNWRMGMPVFAEATGGILPQIESFRQFSSGGLTSRPTLAVLGDNPSKKELVIPEENIKSNQVSGYVRDKNSEGITIVNLISKDDIAQAMASTSGKNVILNTIGHDINTLGRTSKLIKHNY